MPTDIACKRCIEEAEKRLDAMQILCEMVIGQLKGERRQLEEIKAAIASAGKPEEERQAVPSDISPGMLAG
jgi:hypothetical protein